MIISQIKEIRNAGVWNNFSASEGTQFSKRNLIFGFNGSGKTTLSRIFSHIKYGSSGLSLFDSISYKVAFSGDSSSSEIIIDQNTLRHQVGNNILIYNTDFVSKNFLWEEGNINGIIYLSEKAIEAKNNLDVTEINLENIKRERRATTKSLKTSKEFLEDFYERVSRNIVAAIPSDAYFEPYDARKISQIYKHQDINTSMILSLDDLRSYQSLLVRQESLTSLSFSYRIPNDLVKWISLSVSLINEARDDLVSSEFTKYSDAFQWAKQGILYHEDYNLESCLFCGNELSEKRRDYVKFVTRTSPKEHYRSLINAIRRGREIERELEKIIINIPNGTQFISGKRDVYLANREIFIGIMNQLYRYVKRQIIYLSIRRKNPTGDITPQVDIKAFNVDIWYQRYSRIKNNIDSLISDHNEYVENITSIRRRAYEVIEKHILASNKKEWDHISYLHSVNKKTNTDLYIAQKSLEMAIIRAKSYLAKQNVDARVMNELIWVYLGHKEISLEVVGDRYNIRRMNGNLARKLSEGERSAISFCYFLAELKARRTDICNTIAIIDDPVSSLDAVAQTHAFSLMTEITSRCAQVVLLTHSTSFASMVRRSWNKGSGNNCDFTLLSLDCRVSGDSENRETSLCHMPGFSRNHHSEYHYLFNIVYDAAKNGRSDQLFFLPNAIRKFLEVFTSFQYPDQKGFAAALKGEKQKVGSRVDVVALERLIQIESHGTLESLEGHSSLTMQDSIAGAVAAIGFVEAVAGDHYRRMKASCGFSP